jgi:hypothetical protein
MTWVDADLLLSPRERPSASPRSGPFCQRSSPSVFGFRFHYRIEIYGRDTSGSAATMSCRSS